MSEWQPFEPPFAPRDHLVDAGGMAVQSEGQPCGRPFAMRITRSM